MIHPRSFGLLFGNRPAPAVFNWAVKFCYSRSFMDIIAMLSELRAEREQIDEAILVLQRMATGQGKRRGRPPKWMSTGSSTTETADGVKPKRRGRTFNAAQRKA